MTTEEKVGVMKLEHMQSFTNPEKYMARFYISDENKESLETQAAVREIESPSPLRKAAKLGRPKDFSLEIAHRSSSDDY
jgi:hypothetical protein